MYVPLTAEYVWCSDGTQTGKRRNEGEVWPQKTKDDASNKQHSFFSRERERGPRTFLLTRLFFLNVLPVVSIAILAVLGDLDSSSSKHSRHSRLD